MVSLLPKRMYQRGRPGVLWLLWVGCPGSGTLALRKIQMAIEVRRQELQTSSECLALHEAHDLAVALTDDPLVRLPWEVYESGCLLRTEPVGSRAP